MISPEQMIWSDAAVYNNDGKEWKIVSQAWDMQPEGLVSCTEAELLCKMVVKAVNSHTDLTEALEKLLFWNEGILAGHGNHHPQDHINLIKTALAGVKS